MKTMSAVLFALLLVSFGQTQQTWTRTYGGTYDDEGNSVQQTADGGYIVAGYTNSFGDSMNGDVYLIKTNASGNTLWTKTYGGTNVDRGYSVQQTSDGGYVIAGYTGSFVESIDDVYLIKTNASGDTLWTRTYGGARDDVANSAQQTSDGGYIGAGITCSFRDSLNGDVYLTKTDSSGDTLWTRTYGGTQVDEGFSVQQTSDSGYIVAGYTASFGAGVGDVYLIKTNAAGDTLWTKTYGETSDDVGYSVHQTSDGGYIVAGYTPSFGAGNGDVWLIKTNASGDTLWTKTYGGTGDEYGFCVRQTTDGGYIIAGETSPSEESYRDAYLVKTNASGDTLWTRTYGGTDDDAGSSVQQTSDGGYVVAGYTSSFGAGGYDVYLVKTDSGGYVAVEEPGGSERGAVRSTRATPNPFTSFARIPGHEGERFELFDVSGKKVGAFRGSRIGEGLSPAVYFIKLEHEHGGSLRIVKVR